MLAIHQLIKSNNLLPKFSIAHRTFLNEASRRGSTIYALSSGQGKCGVAVVRISGTDARLAIEKMTNIAKLEPRKAYLRNIRNPQTGETIDKGLCLWFPGPNSFTGEDSVEFQVHGGVAVLASLMSALSQLQFQPALPGEFTKRAFFHDKLDLTEIEGLADLIHAETEQQRKQALLQAHGNLSALYSSWRAILLKCLAHIEAYIDFGEEENIESQVFEQCNIDLKDLTKQIEKHLSDGRKGEILRNGIRTVILGEPNVGKSSLLNRLVQRNAAIVTSIPGTTRDVVELTANISGYPIVLADTAGLNKLTEDIIEIEGIKRARDQASKADFIILVMNAEEYVKSCKKYNEYLSSYIKSLELEELILVDEQLASNVMVVVNKVDLLKETDKRTLEEHNLSRISCTDEEGFQELLESMRKHFESICGNPSAENPTISQERHRNHVRACHECLLKYFHIISNTDYDIVLASQEIRKAAKEIGKITGHVSTEEILDTIFKNFCIGK
ncbi:tRNA modification GTPase GTPBP3, mitochondrial isoform X1 [Nasonia vitripennis]|uniref:TrmE-type G domain-containing protein n=2 Tax=Nasonia vitripennis TaxID=7425 RepID=A0A7M7IRU9_NASVI|nr:tRNA modification GTPase GTPBP3, mitochondrial isoform X1 [Nasonia vitripennis]